MNWTNDISTNITDIHINRTVYGGVLTQGEGIDLRAEMHNLLYGSSGKKPKGHWVCLRKYNRNKPSKFYSYVTHEGVGGPAYEYTDSFIRVRKVPIRKDTDRIESIKAGALITD